MLTKKNDMFDLAIIIVGLQLFFFTLLIMKEKDFHTSKNNYFGVNYRMLHVRQPDIVSSVWLEMKPPSVNELKLHLPNVQKKMMFL